VTLLAESVDAYFSLLTEADSFEATLKKAAAGDATAIGEIYTEYQPKFVYMLKGRKLSQDDADDAVQSFFADKVFGKNWIADFYTKNPTAKPVNFVRAMTRAILNSVVSARRKQSVRRTSPLAGNEAAKHTQSQSNSLRTVIKDALARIMKKYKPHEQAFINELLMGPEGSFAPPKHGALQVIAAKHAPKGSKDAANWGAQLRRRFTQQFCADREMCDTLRSHRGETVRATAAKYACKGVSGSCVEEVALLAYGIVESEALISEEVAVSMVLDWLREQIKPE